MNVPLWAIFLLICALQFVYIMRLIDRVSSRTFTTPNPLTKTLSESTSMKSILFRYFQFDDNRSNINKFNSAWIEEATNDVFFSTRLIQNMTNINPHEKTQSIGTNIYNGKVVDGVAVTVMLNTPKWFQRRYRFML
jgi:hypothetical protein